MYLQFRYEVRLLCTFQLRHIFPGMYKYLKLNCQTSNIYTHRMMMFFSIPWKASTVDTWTSASESPSVLGRLLLLRNLSEDLSRPPVPPATCFPGQRICCSRDACQRTQCELISPQIHMLVLAGILHSPLSVWELSKIVSRCTKVNHIHRRYSYWARTCCNES